MAERKVVPTTVLLMIDPAGGTSYKTIICLTGFKFTRSTNIVDASTFCGPDKSPGSKDLGITFEGQLWVDGGVTKVDGADLHDLWDAKTTVGWKIGPAVPVTGDPVYAGTGFIASLDDDYSQDNSTFSGSLGVYGNASKTITA